MMEKITLNDAIKQVGTFPIAKGIVTQSFDFNNAGNGIYTVNRINCPNQPVAAIGTLVSFSDTYQCQIYVPILTDAGIYMRASDTNNRWTEWRNIM